MSKMIGDYFASAGSFLLDTTREAIWRHDEESRKEERNAGMFVTVAALYDAGVSDEQIEHLIQKYYGVCPICGSKEVEVIYPKGDTVEEKNDDF